MSKPPFCNKCGMMIKIHKMYTFCSSCEKFLYKYKKLLLSKNPPVMTPRGIALAALRIEGMTFVHEDWVDYDSYSEAFLNDMKCIPNHLKDLKSNYLMYDYLDAITETMLFPSDNDFTNWTSEMKNSRTAILTELKSCIYGNMGRNLDPFLDGPYSSVFLKLDSRIGSSLETLRSYVGEIYCCFECNVIGSKHILLNLNRTIHDKCSDCD